MKRLKMAIKYPFLSLIKQLKSEQFLTLLLRKLNLKDLNFL